MRESLELFAGYYRHPLDVDQVVDLVGLEEKRDARVRRSPADSSAGSTSASA